MARHVGQKTYSHLAKLDRVPGHYEIATTSLLYHVKQGFSINLDAKEWQREFLYESPLFGDGYEDFIDPRKAYYGRYIEQQKEKEAYVFKIFEKIEASKCLAELHPKAFFVFSEMVPVMRYVFHSLEMGASYLGHLAPSSRVLIPLMFQAADEMRRIQLMAYLMGLFRRHYAQFGDDSRSIWERDVCFQPLRRVLEEMLVTYDFGEAFIALNRVIKPKIDFVLVKTLSDVAAKYEAHLLNDIFSSIEEDSLWHDQWSSGLVELIAQENQKSSLIESFVDKWSFRVDEAISLITKDDLHNERLVGEDNAYFA